MVEFSYAVPVAGVLLIGGALHAKSVWAPRKGFVAGDGLKDRDGTVHVRYERTYDGLPVLGGDLVVQGDRPGETESVVKATRAAVKPATTTAKVSTAKAEQQALSAAKAEDAKSPTWTAPRAR
ncbi:hypothetical protein SHIRM173S_05684 [Streptomyces hirsutus]